MGTLAYGTHRSGSLQPLHGLLAPNPRELAAPPLELRNLKGNFYLRIIEI